MRFVLLKKENLKIVAFTDALFANNTDNTLQIGFVIVLTDELNANIVH